MINKSTQAQFPEGVSASKAAAILGVNPKTVFRAIGDGRIVELHRTTRCRMVIPAWVRSGAYEQKRMALWMSKIRDIHSRRPPRPRMVCVNCGDSFEISPSSAGKRKYCSWSCRSKHMRGRFGANFGKGENIRQERNPRWDNGGIGPRDDSWKRAIWSRRVIRRAGRKCTRCGSLDQLRAHHVAPWKNFTELRFDESNGVCLCLACHIWVHGKQNTDHLFLKIK